MVNESENAFNDIKEILKTADIACLYRMRNYSEASLVLINTEIKKRLSETKLKKIKVTSTCDE